MNKNTEYIKAMNKLYELNIPKEDFLSAEKELAHFEKSVKDSKNYVEYCFGHYNGYNIMFSYDKHTKKTEILFKQEDKPPFLKAFKFNNFYLRFIPNPEDLNKILKLISSYSNSAEKAFKNMEELKQFTIDEGFSDLNYDDLRLLFWLTNTEKKRIEKYKNEKFSKIVLVIEKDNKRIYAKSSTNTYGGDYEIKCVTPDDEEYNYIDEGRLIYSSMFIDELKEDDLSIEILDYINRNANFDVINKSRYEIMKKKKKEHDNIQNAKETFDKVLADRLKQGIFHNNIKFTQHFIEYDKLKIGSNDFDIIGFVRTYIDFEKDIDFNVLFDNFCNYAITVKEFENDKTKQLEIFLGKYSVRLRKEVRKKINCSYNKKLTGENQEEPIKEETKSVKYLVEGVRINKEEIPDVLKRTLCFPNRIDFVFFLKEINRCSIKLHRLLSCGLRIPMKENDETKTLKFNITRKDRKNYLVYGDKRFKIKNSNSFFSKENASGYRTMDIQQMIQYFINQFEVTADDTIGAIKEAMKEHEQVIKRSEEYLQRAVNSTGAKRTTLNIDNNDIKGYLVKGQLNSYFVTDDLKIYTHPSLKYICVLDADLDNQLTNDKLARRLYHLKNDKFVLDNVHTLKG